MADARLERSHFVPTAVGVLSVAVLLAGGLVAAQEPPQEQVVEVRVTGNRTVPTSKIMGELRTRAGRPFRPELVQRDVRQLATRGWFTDVRPLYEQVPGGRIVIFQVAERPTLRYVKYLGNEKIKDKVLTEQTGLKVGDAVDPYAVEEGRRKVERYYLERGYNNVRVEILEGTSPTDHGAVYVIHEGPVQRVFHVRFVGNTIASDARLRTQIKSKPGWFWFFKGYVDRNKIEEDIDRLTAYYRGLGYFRARVGRELEFSESGNWLTLTFVIDEGPRYQVRNVSLVGSKTFPIDQLKAKLELKPGQFFNQTALNGDVGTLRDIYGSQGFVYADIQADTRFLEEPGQLDLVYDISEGDRYRVGRITVHIQGENPHTRIQTVLNRVSLRTGDIVDVRELRKSERRLRASGLFAADPLRGNGPKIVFAPPETADRQLAEGDRPNGIRGQSPDPPASGRPPAGRSGDRILDLEIFPPTEQNQPPALEPRPAGQTTLPPPPRQRPRGELTIRGQNPGPYGPYRPSPPRYHYGSRPMGARGPAEVRRTAQPPPQHAGNPAVPRRNAAWQQSPPTAYYPSQANHARQAAPSGPPPAYHQQPPRSHYGSRPMGARGPAEVRRTAQPPPQHAGNFARPRRNVRWQQSRPTAAYYPPQSNYGPEAGAYRQPAYHRQPPLYRAQNSSPGDGPAASVALIDGADGGLPSYAEPYGLDPYYAPNEVLPYLDLEVQIEETQTGRLMFGVGVNSDAGVIGQITVDEQNFDILRWPSSFEDIRNGTAFRGAGQRFRLELMPGDRVQRYLMNFQEPYFLDTPVSFGASGFFYDRRHRDWEEERVGGRVSLGYQLTPDLSATAAYRGELINVHDPSIPTPPELVEVLGDNALHGFKASLQHDTRDSPFLASQGHLIEMSFEQVVGDFVYPRGEIDLRRYFLVRQRPDGSGRHVISLAGRAGFAGSDTPLYDHYFAGGFSTLRGFEFRGASPRKFGVSVGGEFLLLGSIEYLMPVTADDMLRTVFFCDFGTVEEDVEINNFRVAPGVGLRVTVPAMGPAPIALDFAFPVVTAPGDEEQIFSFNVGFLR